MRKIAIIPILTVLLLSCREPEVRIPVPEGTLCLEPLAEDAIRVRVVPDGAPVLEELIYTQPVQKPRYRVKKTGDRVSVTTARLTAEYHVAEGKLLFKDADGQVLLEEKSRSLQPSPVREHPAFDITQTFVSPEGEALFGTGQFQDGYLDIRGLTRRLTQVNSQISLPMVVSNRGYGLLWHNYGLTDFNPSEAHEPLSLVETSVESASVNVTGTSGNFMEIRRFNRFAGEIDLPEDGDYALLLDVGSSMARKQYLAVDGEVLVDFSNFWLPPTVAVKAHLKAGKHRVEVRAAEGDAPVLGWRRITGETTFHSPVSQGIDYTVFAGNADAVMHAFRRLSGSVPPMPDWAFRYIHCRERYDTQEELLTAARRFHAEGIPVGTIVQDWQWWGKHGWNAMRFDEDKYPDPAGMVRELHGMDQHLMLSVWSKVDQGSEVGRQMKENGYYIDGTDWVDFFQPDAAACYWENFRDRLLPVGIDAWWLDATEPENDDLANRAIGPDGIPGEFYRNVYPLKVVGTVYDGLRKDAPDRLPVILTRSAFPGIQRYGAMTWSGDVGADWGSFRRQIAGGLGQMAAGLPWWTYDAGGFFRPTGQYDDPDYQECMVRWIQTAVYLPFMRVHGYVSHTEPWEYPDRIRQLFEEAIDRRESLQPYILRHARRVWEEDYTLMRPLVFDFPGDAEALRQDAEFMFGPDYLVCPVTAPKVTSWRVYLPENKGGWIYLRDETHYEGGSYAEVPVDLENIPVFKRVTE
ncbi:MAG: DUF4968 domain-containing protein [Bacteroidales bacterium]|nr:DUF4968 domain-containing protein [Bacteroidales bacterium]